MSGKDITEGRANRSIAVDIGNLTGTIWQNTGVQYDIAVGGIPFLLDATSEHPYERSTAPFRKNQFDTQRDPGEQSITGWWFRSQSSFHAGQGIDFYDPFANPFSTTLASNSYRFAKSFGINPWTAGQVTLLNTTNNITNTTAALHLDSANVSGTDYVIMLDSNTIYLVNSSGTKTTLTTGSSNVYSFCTDGTSVYYQDGGNVKSIALTGGSPTTLFTSSISVTSSAMSWVKERLVVGLNNKLYEAVGGTGGALPTPVYAHPNAAWQWTNIDEAGPAIYAAGYSGGQSTIYMFVLTTTGAMPVLTSGIVAASFPTGETIDSLYCHLGTYMAIGTNKGVRVAEVDQATGYLSYGPILVYTNTPVRGFAARDSYVWFGTTVTDNINYYAGTWRIDLSNEIDTLRFATAQDVYADGISGTVYDIAFLGNTNQLAFLATTSAGTPSGLGLYLQDPSNVLTTGWIETGYIRYNTLEPKNFKRVVGRGDFGIASSSDYPGGVTKGSMSISTIDDKGNLYDVVTYDNNVGTPEATITAPVGAQDAIALRFTLNRDATDTTLSPVFKGYQLKSVPASPRQRIIKIPLLCYDVDTDKYNATVGYEGYGYDKLAGLETIEANGDVITFQDFRTGETAQCLVEELSFINKISPDKRLTNFGGTIVLTIRTV
jgi:hypothetical protein